jgi:hypothetical protein
MTFGQYATRPLRTAAALDDGRGRKTAITENVLAGDRPRLSSMSGGT